MLLTTMGALIFPLAAVEIGTDDFNDVEYTDGPVDGLGGGTGFAFNWGAMDQTNNGGTSVWEYPGFGDANDQNVVSNTLITGQSVSTGGGGGSLRRFGEDRGNAAVQGTGQIFYKVEMTRSAASAWSGLSHMDWGTEKVQFGVPFENAGTDTIGIETSNTDDNGVTPGTISLDDGNTYTLVCVVDFSNDKVAMFVDPPASAYWTSTGNNNADVVRTFTNGNWASDVRLASDGDTTWDNLSVGTEAGDVGLQDFVDADGDGLPQAWEEANNLDDNDDGTTGESSQGAKDGPNGALGNPDNDGLTNREEFDGFGIAGFEGQTDPQDEDSDDDDLFDGPEVLEAMTDPLDPDSDGDELTDGAEVNVHNTNPTLLDTDTGGTSDGTEIALGTLPQAGNAADDGDAPSGDLAFIGLEMFDYPDGSIGGKTGGDGFDFDNQDSPDSFMGHTKTSSDWNDLFGDPQVTCQGLQTEESGALREFNGLSSGESANTSETSGGIFAEPVGSQSHSVFWVKVDIKRSSGAGWSGLSAYSYGAEKAFIGVTGAAAATDSLSYEEPGGANQQISDLTLTDGETNTIVARIEPKEGFVDIYLNPDLDGEDPYAADPNGADIVASMTPTDLTGLRLASGGSGPTDWDNLCVASTWAGLSTPPADSEPNGLRDSFQAGFGVSDPNANLDGDGFTNLEEQQANTNPNLGDTDNDGANDDIEVTGSSNSFPNPSTDPCIPDSDGDGLLDGAELTGTSNPFDGAPTDPNRIDSDGDEYTDASEGAAGTDPNDENSNPGAQGIIVIDGTKDALYGDPIALQTIESGWSGGNNQLAGAYAYLKDEKLYLMITGRSQDNFNKVSILIDSTDAVTTNVFTSAGNDASNNMDGMTFDAGFAPDYHMILRHGFRFDLDFSNLETQAFDSYLDVFNGAGFGAGSTPAGTVNSQPIGIAYDDSEQANISMTGGTPVDPEVAASIPNGFELCIDLADIGSPSGDIKVMVMLGNDGNNYFSNQTLGGLPEGTGDLGDPKPVNFDTLEGEQYFAVVIEPLVDLPTLTISPFDPTNNQVVLSVTDIPEGGGTYHIESSPDGETFTALPESEFTSEESFPYGPILGSGKTVELFRVRDGAIAP